MDSKGNLFGTARSGGLASLSCGVVFEFSSPEDTDNDWLETILYRFGEHFSDGCTPQGNLAVDWSESMIWYFGNADGAVPDWGVTRDGKGRLYGTTQIGNSSFWKRRKCLPVDSTSRIRPGLDGSSSV
jgi:hypothetical protein